MYTVHNPKGQDALIAASHIQVFLHGLGDTLPLRYNLILNSFTPASTYIHTSEVTMVWSTLESHSGELGGMFMYWPHWGLTGARADAIFPSLLDHPPRLQMQRVGGWAVERGRKMWGRIEGGEEAKWQSGHLSVRPSVHPSLGLGMRGEPSCFKSTHT